MHPVLSYRPCFEPWLGCESVGDAARYAGVSSSTSSVVPRHVSDISVPGALAGIALPDDASSSGIGLETCVLMVKEGASVLMADISRPALDKAVAKVRELVSPAQTQHLETITCDVSIEAQVQAAVERLDGWGGVDVVFNNAGIMHHDDNGAIDTAEAVWDLTQKINVKGVWYGCKHAVLSLRRHKKTNGSIINTASVVALVGSATPQLAYTASKGAVMAMTRELAIAHAREGRCCSGHPAAEEMHIGLTVVSRLRAGFRFNAICPAPLK